MLDRDDVHGDIVWLVAAYPSSPRRHPSPSVLLWTHL